LGYQPLLFEKIKQMKIINNKKEAIEELKRISTRTNSENNNKINAIVEEILQEVKNYGDEAVEKFTKNLMVSILPLCKLVQIK
jgi:histidinol dehydrogenase